MSAPATVVVVGASLAGTTAAETLRAEGFGGRIVLVGDEPQLPYERPPLSKDYLLGKADRDSVFLHPEGWYAEHDVELRLGTEVVGLDPAAHEVVTGVGERVAYDRLLLATGSTPRRLDVGGADLAGVHYLRRLEDSDRIKAGFGEASRVAIVGGGWIGLETAAAARAAGLHVTVLEATDLPLGRVLGREVAPVFANLHRRHGVDLRCGVQVAELSGDGGGVDGRGVENVRLAGGDVVPADLVLVGVGITPNSGLAAAAGIDVDNGITVDEHLRTSAPDVYAAGDVANAYHPRLGRRLRVEHWANALAQGATAARAMLDQDAVHDAMPFFFTDQYELGMEYRGDVGPGGHDEVVFRGDPATGAFLVFWLSGRRVLAGMNVNTWDVGDPIEDLVRTSRRVDPARLADPAVALEDV